MYKTAINPETSRNDDSSFLSLRGVKSNLLVFLALFLLSILVFQIHEVGHFTLGKICGLDLSYGYSHVQAANQEISQIQKFFFVLGGPLLTYAFSFISLLMVVRNIKPCFFLLFGLSHAFLRARAMFKCVVNLQGFQDECQLATIVGLPEFSLAWVSLGLAVTLIILFIYLTPDNRFRTFFFSLINSFIGPGLVFMLIPYLP